MKNINHLRNFQNFFTPISLVFGAEDEKQIQGSMYARTTDTLDLENSGKGYRLSGSDFWLSNNSSTGSLPPVPAPRVKQQKFLLSAKIKRSLGSANVFVGLKGVNDTLASYTNRAVLFDGVASGLPTDLTYFEQEFEFDPADTYYQFEISSTGGAVDFEVQDIQLIYQYDDVQALENRVDLLEPRIDTLETDILRVPSVIRNLIEDFNSRALSDSYNLTDFQVFSLLEILELYYLRSKGFLPIVYINSKYSFNLNNSSSTKLYNPVSSSDGTILNSDSVLSIDLVGNYYKSFDASNFSVLDTGNNQHYNDFIISMWFKPDFSVSQQTLFNKGSGSARSFLYDTGLISFNTDSGALISSSGAVSSSAVTNVIFAYSSDPAVYNAGGTNNGSGAIWVDGVRVVDGDGIQVNSNLSNWQISRSSLPFNSDFYSFSVFGLRINDLLAKYLYDEEKILYQF